MKNKREKTKGITLIALVITIIILLILAGVTISTLSGDNGIIRRAVEAKERTNKENAEESIKMLLTEVQTDKFLGKDSFENLLVNKVGKDNVEKNPDGTISVKKDGYQVKVDSKGNQLTEAEKIVENIVDKSGVSIPKIPVGVEVKFVDWDESGNEIEASELTYDYTNGKWANIKTVSNGLEAYWVWIPRFEYKIPSGDIDKMNPPQIDIKFINKDKKIPDLGYTIHKAFEFNGQQLDGIWVAKFEANSSKPGESHGGGDRTDLKVQVKPTAISWRKISTKNIFTVCRNMQKGGVLGGTEGTENPNLNGHMMKNIEWGAVAILSQSKYGVYNPKSSNGGKIWNNPDNQFYTGRVGDAQNSSETNVTAIEEYNQGNGPKASTTGTIYGIYDMSGGSWEYVAGCLSGKIQEGFGTEATNIYVDEYQLDTEIKGDATKETAGWNSDTAVFINKTDYIFRRGGNVGNSDSAGIFYYSGKSGNFERYGSFRPVFVAY